MRSFSSAISAIFALIVLIAERTHGFSAGVPPLKSVCTDMLPHHHDYKPQGTSAPYEILVSANTLPGGGDIFVTLNSTLPNGKFRGFYMQARDGNLNPIGSFSQNEVAKAHNCLGMRHNSVYHANGKIEKQMATFSWTAPKDFTGEVIFISTVVRDFVTIWAGLYSESVTITPYVKKPRPGLFGGGGGGGDGDNGGGLIGLIGALGINIPGITPPQNNNNANTNQQ